MSLRAKNIQIKFKLLLLRSLGGFSRSSSRSSASFGGHRSLDRCRSLNSRSGSSRSRSFFFLFAAGGECSSKSKYQCQ